MKTLKQFFKAISVKQLLVVFLAGVLVLVSTACGTTQAAAPFRNDQNGTSSGQAMYPYRDNQRDTSDIQAKTDRMVRQAQQNQRRVQSPQDYLDEVTPDRSLDQQAKVLGRSAKRTAEDVGESTKRAAQDAVKSTQRGFNDLKDNAADAARQAADAVDRATNPS